jgi:hypothetical protein
MRFMDIIRASDYIGRPLLHLGTTTVHGFLRTHFLNATGSPSQLVNQLNLACSLGGSRAVPVEVHKIDGTSWPWTIDMLRVAPRSKGGQDFLGWMLDEASRMQPATDDRGACDIARELEREIGNLVEGPQLCTLSALAFAWAKTYGCPPNRVLSVNAMASSNPPKWIVDYWDYDPPRGGRIVWRFNGEVVLHTGVDDLPPPSEFGATFPRVCHPRELGTPARGDGKYAKDGKMEVMRHHGQHSGLRRKGNPGLHQLPGDFEEAITRAPAPWAREVQADVDELVGLLHWWKRQFNIGASIVITASAEEETQTSYHWKHPVLNLVCSDSAGHLVKRTSMSYLGHPVLTVQVHGGGAYLRGLRAFAGYRELPFLHVCLMNGNIGSGAWIHDLDPREENLPCGSVCWIHTLYAVNNLWIRPGCLKALMRPWYFENTVTIYGGDEVPFLKMKVTTIMKAPPHDKRGRPWMGYDPDQSYDCDVTILNIHREEIMHITHYTAAVNIELADRFYPGRRYTAPRAATGASLRPSWANAKAYATVRYELPRGYGQWDWKTWVCDDPSDDPGWDELEAKSIGGGRVCIMSHTTPRRRRGEDNKKVVDYVVNRVTGEEIYEHDAVSKLYADYIPWLFYCALAYVQLCVLYWNHMLRPNHPAQNPGLSVSEEEFPPDYNEHTRGNMIVVQTLGTTGDIRPMLGLANAIAGVGVRTHLVNTQTSTADLEGLKEGHIGALLPAYSDLTYTGKWSYGGALVPHVEVEGCLSYTLSPPRRYIHDMRYSDKMTDLPLWRQALLTVMEWLWRLFRPALHIGNLRGCNAPRYTDMHNLLTRRTNKGRIPEGWTSGSAAEEVIPEYIRARAERIPPGDHNEIMRDYKVIHHHNGAGTKQTALAAGCEEQGHDITLDRHYKRPLSQVDYYEPDMSVVYGYVVAQGIEVDLAWPLRAWCLGRYLWAMKMRYLYDGVMFALKITVILFTFTGWLGWLAALIVSMPELGRRALTEFVTDSVLRWIVGLLWRSPVLFHAGLVKGLLWIALVDSQWFMGLIQDFSGWRRWDAEVLIEPADNQGLPFPVRHFGIIATQTGEIFEGAFTEKGRKGMGDPFGFRVTTRRPRPGAIRIPVTMNLWALRKWTMDSQIGPYGPRHNCTQLVSVATQHRGFLTPLAGKLIHYWVALLLAPPSWLLTLFIQYDKLTTSSVSPDYRESGLYKALGFAAAGPESLEGGTPFVEPVMKPQVEAVAAPELPGGPPEELVVDPLFQGKDWAEDPEGMSKLMDGLAILIAISMDCDPTLELDDALEIGVRTMCRAVEGVELPDVRDPDVMPNPPELPSDYMSAVAAIVRAAESLGSYPVVGHFLQWLAGARESIREFVRPVCQMFSLMLRWAGQFGQEQWMRLWSAINWFLDHTFGPDSGKGRKKTAWIPDNLLKGQPLSARARLEAELAMAEFVGRTNYSDDFEGFIEQLRQHAKAHPVAKDHLDDLGGEQRRRLHVPKPVMSRSEAELLGLGEGDYIYRADYDERIRKILAQGVQQGLDGVHVAHLDPDRTATSIGRYEPSYPVDTDPVRRDLMHQTVDAIFNQFQAQFKDARTVSLGAVSNYLVKKYSPGLGFIHPGGPTTRQVLQDHGYLDVLQSVTHERLRSGKFPVEFFHCFPKSQVVDGVKLMREGKDPRTIAANWLPHTFLENWFQLDQTKRPCYAETGLGSGMPLDQFMARHFQAFADRFKLEDNTNFIIIDATAFDSACRPILFDGVAELQMRGFEDHWKSREIASVITAHMDSLQDAWIVDVTQPRRTTLAIGARDDYSYRAITALGHDRIIPAGDWTDWSTIPDDKILLLRGKHQLPKGVSWQGCFEFSHGTNDPARFDQDQQVFCYPRNDPQSLVRDIKRLVSTPPFLIDNVHPKNRGGATGFTSTTFTNSWAYRIGIIMAWSLTKGLRPSEFFAYNDFKNTSDDAMWATWGKGALLKKGEIFTFKRHCQSLGINLKLETTREITEVDYLSKLVRAPNPTDREDLQAWRHSKYTALSQSGQLRPDDPTQREKYADPGLIVYQNAAAILLRRTAMRFNTAGVTRYQRSMIQRSAGHANVTAFCRPLYSGFAQDWVTDTNNLLSQHNIWQRYEVRHDQYGLPTVVQANPRWKEQALSPRQVEVLKFIKSAKYPSYLKVLTTHLQDHDPDPAAHEKFMAKIQKGVRGWEEITREVLDGAWFLTDQIPRGLYSKFMPSPDMLYPDNPMTTVKARGAKMTLKCLMEDHPLEEIDYSLISENIKESPWACGTSALQAWSIFSDVEKRNEVINTPRIFYQAGMIGVLCAYMMIWASREILKRIFLIGTLISIWEFSFIGASKIFSVTSVIVWHSLGRMLPEVSRLMPKDPYVVDKRLAVLVMDLVPDAMVWLLTPLAIANNALVEGTRAFCRFWTHGQKLKETSVTHTEQVNPWLAHAKEQVDMLRASPQKRIYLKADTGTGKSTWNIAALYTERKNLHITRVWLVLPYKRLRDSWDPPGQFDIPYQVLMRGARLKPGTFVAVCTYGHFMTSRAGKVTETDIVMFDEFHEEKGEMILANNKIKSPAVFVSATPVTIKGYEKGIKTKVVSMPRRHKIRIHEQTSGSVLDWYQYARTTADSDLCDRALFIVPTIADVKRLVASLHWLKVEAHEVSSRTAHLPIPKTGCLVATNIVQAGLDIKPPAKILFDSGKDMIIDKGVAVFPIPWTCKAVAEQRKGRVGRLCDGVVYRHKKSGTGPRPIIYPSGHMFEHKVIADHYDVPQLTPTYPDPAGDDKIPFMGPNAKILRDKHTQYSVHLISALAMSGVREQELELKYSMIKDGRRLTEDEWWLDQNVIKNERWRGVQLLPWAEALTWASKPNCYIYSIGGRLVHDFALKPSNGRWRPSDAMIEYEGALPPEESKVRQALNEKVTTANVSRLTSELATLKGEQYQGTLSAAMRLF